MLSNKHITASVQWFTVGMTLTLTTILSSCGLDPPKPPDLPKEPPPPYTDTTPEPLYDRSSVRPAAQAEEAVSFPFDAPPTPGNRVALTAQSGSACEDRRNAQITIQNQVFQLTDWSTTAWARQQSTHHYQNFVTKIGDYFVFLQNNLSTKVIIAGQMYSALNKQFNGQLLSYKFAGIAGSTYDHPVAKLSSIPEGYLLKYIWGNNHNTRKYDVEFQFAHAGACLARYHTSQQTPYSGGEPLLVLKTMPYISYYTKPHE